MILHSQRIHFIGICGVAMGALAIAFKKAGRHVTGSDAGFFPPVSDALEAAGVSFYPGWHPERMIADGSPDLVVVGNVASSTNPEWQYVQERHIAYRSYPELIAEYIVKPTSVVCAGTYGKTTTAALLSWILSQAEKNPSYMFGGLSAGDAVSAALTDGSISVLEGDEYKSARWDNRPKFAHYSPTHLLLTGISWDHADVYPTKESYTEAFRGLLRQMPQDGLVVACADDETIRGIKNQELRIKTYGAATDAEYRYTDVKQTTNGLQYTIIHDRELYYIESPMLGEYNAANITGVFAMATTLGIAPEAAVSAIKKFSGLKRRLEKRYDGAVAVFDDIAHSPAKARATLQTIRKIYKKKIIAVFEPNTGNRKSAALPSYDGTFAQADEVIIPALTKVKKNPDDPDMSGEDVARAIRKTHKNVRSMADDDALVAHIAERAKSGDVVIFLGSHGFRGMIDELIQLISLRLQSPPSQQHP